MKYSASWQSVVRVQYVVVMLKQMERRKRRNQHLLGYLAQNLCIKIPFVPLPVGDHGVYFVDLYSINVIVVQ